MYKKFFVKILILAIAFAGCSNVQTDIEDAIEPQVIENNDCEVKEDGEISLIGTKWKLSGLVYNKTGEIKELKPVDCEDCYTLWFDTDSTVSIINISTRLKLNLFDLQPQILMDLALRSERYDKDNESYIESDLFRRFILRIDSYTATCDELKLFHVRGDHVYDDSYLSFRPHDGKNPLTSVRGTYWKLAGVVDIQTGDIRELEPNDCVGCYTLNFVGEYDIDVRSITATHTYNLLNFSVFNPHLPSFTFMTDSVEQWKVDFPWYGLGDGKPYEDTRLFRWGVLNAESFELSFNELKIFFSYLGKSYYLSFKCIYR